tara:strand:- start:346 stop:900 length:555 start_codon:yes stop_codon:yes gene_type:complete
MGLKTIIIHQNKYLHHILSEISKNINCKIIHTDHFNLNYSEFKNYILITNKKFPEIKNQLVLNNFPIKIYKLIEIINLAFLKQEYSFKSNIKIGKYELNLNSRMLSLNGKKLDLTEMEANVILFLKNSNEPSSVRKLQKNVWGHVPDLETHTVETHIYRLRKKIKDKFQDDDFIKSFKDGYQII